MMTMLLRITGRFYSSLLRGYKSNEFKVFLHCQMTIKVKENR